MGDAAPFIEDSEESKWYIINCVTGFELVVERLLQVMVDNVGIRSEVLEIKVPTQTLSMTRGKRVSTKQRTLYPSYVFAHLYMSQEVYDAIMATDHVMSFVGVRSATSGRGRKAAKRVIPQPLSAGEIKQFRLNEEEGAKLEDPTFGFSIGDFVEILTGPTKGERGYLRLVRDGQVVVRLMAYGRRMDLDFDPVDVRRLGAADLPDLVELEEGETSTPKRELSEEEQARKLARAEEKARRWQMRQEKQEQKRLRQPGARTDDAFGEVFGEEDATAGTVKADLDTEFSPFQDALAQFGAPSGSSKTFESSAVQQDSTRLSLEDDDLLAELMGDNFLETTKTSSSAPGGGNVNPSRDRKSAQLTSKEEEEFLSLLLEEGDDDSSASVSAEDAAMLQQQEDDFLNMLFDDSGDMVQEDDLITGDEGGHVASSAAGAGTGAAGATPPRDISELTVPQLKEELRSLGLKVGGRKAELQERLVEALQGQP